jgi:RND superfamily putative drug exporter
VLLPATMKLLGERNWYLPRFLSWLPRAEPARSRAELECPSAALAAASN